MFIKTSIDMWFKSRLTKCSVFKDINELLELIPQNKFSKRIWILCVLGCFKCYFLDIKQ